MQRSTWLLGLSFFFATSCSDDAKESPPKSADSGFSLKEHAFRFENFATGYDGSRMTPDLAGRMFGKDKVCRKGFSYCEPTTDAQVWLDSANDAMDVGRCEGFAVLSQLFFLGRLNPKDFGADTVAELKLDENYALQKELAYWFATQLVPGAVDNRALMPRDAIKFMAEFMGGEEHYRIGMVQRTATGFGDAHSLTPISFERGESDNLYYLRVYDNNFPDVERRLRLDLSSNSWEYEGVNDEGAMMFRGSEADGNPLYFAPTVAREGTLPCPFCKSDAGLTMVAHGVSPLLKDAMGNEVGFKDGKIVETGGGKVSPGFATCIDGVAPVVVSSNTPADMPVEVTLNPNGASYQNVRIQGGSMGSVTVGGDISSMKAAQLQVSGETVTIQPGGKSTTISFITENKTYVQVTVDGEAGDVKISRDPTTGKLKIETNEAKGARVSVTLADVSGTSKGDNRKTTYSFTAGEDDSSLAIDLPQEGWKEGSPPSASLEVDGSKATVAVDTCRDKVLSGDETDVDCGGAVCRTCSNVSNCKLDRDCESGVCGAPNSTRPNKCVDGCGDGLKSGNETDVDCGGSCAAKLWWCDIGEGCAVNDDCEGEGRKHSYGPGSYERNPHVYCSPKGRCTTSPVFYALVDEKYGGSNGIEVRLWPDGLDGDATIQRIERASVYGVISFKETMVTAEYRLEVVRNPSSNVACWMSEGGSGNIGTTLYFEPAKVTCEAVATLCANGKKDLNETDLDCGGRDCGPLGSRCGVGKNCSTDGDCGGGGQSAVCGGGTCKKTYDVRGSLYTTVPLTLELTPGGTSTSASSAPRRISVAPSDTSFAFTNTRVTESYSVKLEAPAGVTCEITGAGGSTAGVSESYVSTTSISCISCDNGKQEGKETGTDCGGADCREEDKLCPNMSGCGSDADCTSGTCDVTNKVCLAASCTNNKQDGDETGSDCGGSCVNQSKTCGLTVGCELSADCTSKICDATSKTCVSCGDGLKNGTETHADCGGTTCIAQGKTCALTNSCAVNSDCASSICDTTSMTCVSCGDGSKNGTETDIDCGGSTCVGQGKRCGDGDGCNAASDCSDSLLCSAQSCAAAATWRVTNQNAFGATTMREGIALAADDIWAIGDDTLAHYNGTNWTSEEPLGQDNPILSLFARLELGEPVVWVAGSDNAVQYWNGSQWFSILSSFTGTAAINAIHGTDTLVLAVGSGGQIARYGQLSEEFTSEFGSSGGGPGGGLPGTPAPTTEDLHAVFVLDGNHAWAVGNNGAIVELDTGFWSTATSPTTAALRSVWAAAADDVWAVGDGGVIIHFDGSDWSTVTSGTTNDLASVWGANADNVWAAGEAGTIRYFSGEGWSGEDSGTSRDLSCVFGAEANRWAMGTGSLLVERN